MLFKLLLDKNVENGKQILYERLLAFLNGKSLMANVDKDDCDWARLYPDGGGESPGELLLETIRHICRLYGLSHLEAKYVVLMLKYKICRLIELDLGHTDILAQSDITIIRIACRQVAALASELTSVSHE